MFLWTRRNVECSFDDLVENFYLKSEKKSKIYTLFQTFSQKIQKYMISSFDFTESWNSLFSVTTLWNLFIRDSVDSILLEKDFKKTINVFFASESWQAESTKKGFR